MKYKVLFIAILFLISCNKEEEEVEVRYLEINNVELTDLGQIADKYSFHAYLKNDSVCQVLIRTIMIAKGDSIQSIEVYTEGYALDIKISSTASLWGCTEDSCLTVHDLCFDLKGLKEDTYYVSLNLNNSLIEKFNYDFHKSYYGN